MVLILIQVVLNIAISVGVMQMDQQLRFSGVWDYKRGASYSFSTVRFPRLQSSIFPKGLTFDLWSKYMLLCDEKGLTNAVK